jgi:radical SAM superfamily enzyme YgiQ (UPF0313 family)
MTTARKQHSDILLITANARYSHTSLALRFLRSNLRNYKEMSDIMEFTIDEKPVDIVEAILRRSPKVVCLSVYIWNTLILEEVAHMLKQVAKEIRIVAGGPEISYDSSAHSIYNDVDYIIAGEGEVALPALLDAIYQNRPIEKSVLQADPVSLADITLPYGLYTDEDIQHRVIYVEASRGCPFSCAFCLSALDKKVRRYPENRVIDALDELYRRGARRFKFLDRALHLAITPRLIGFFLEKRDPSLFVHFELVPDHLPRGMLHLLKAFPPGSVQVEAGLQTLDETVARRIGRKQNIGKALQTLELLRWETGVHIHTDLIIGLPGEALSQFEDGFNRLFALKLHEIQVGILKKLPGAPIAVFDEEWQMVYSRKPPYEILSNRQLDFCTVQRLKRFAKYFDIIYNRGHFDRFLPCITENEEPFARLLHLSDWLYEKLGRTHGIALNRLAELLFEYVVMFKKIEKSEAANRLYFDFATARRRSFPGSVETHVTDRPRFEKRKGLENPLPTRQRRHHRTG